MITAYHFGLRFHRNDPVRRTVARALEDRIFVVPETSKSAAVRRLVVDDHVWARFQIAEFPSMNYDATTIHPRFPFFAIRRPRGVRSTKLTLNVRHHDLKSAA